MQISMAIYIYADFRRACSYPYPYPVFQACLLGGEEEAAAIHICAYTHAHIHMHILHAGRRGGGGSGAHIARPPVFRVHVTNNTPRVLDITRLEGSGAHVARPPVCERSERVSERERKRESV